MVDMDISAYQNMRISTRGKRPLRNLTPGDKVRAIQRIHNGETKASVSRDIGVPESTLRGWCKNEQKLRFMCRQLGAAINETALPLSTGLENPPEKRSKLVDSFDYGHAYGFNRLGMMSSANSLNSANNSKVENKTSNFISNNALSEFMKKNNFGYEATKQPSSDSVCFQSINNLPTTSNFSSLPFLQNAHLLSMLNPNLKVPNLNAVSKYESSLDKSPLRSLNTVFETKNKTKKQTPSLMVKNWTNESLSIPTVSNSKHTNNNSNVNAIDKNDTNNNDVRPALSSSRHNNDFGEFPSFFPLGLPLPTVPTVDLDPETRNNAILQWTKVFNASLNFLALAAAAAAVQPNLTEPDAASSINSDSSETAYHQDDFEIGPTRPLTSIEHSEDSNFESEPEDLSIRSCTSKLSSPLQTPTQDIMSDSSTLSDNDN